MATKQASSNGKGRDKQTTLDLLTQRTGNNTTGVKLVEFHELFSANYGLYGLHVVQERALPDARDGLKPVQRRILYTMYEGRYLASGSHRKSAEIVGKVLGDRHPHGDASVYDAMARMAQPFTLRYPFIDGQGNWGASDGSPAAAYRYTEAKLTRLAEALISEDIARQTVPMVMTYKEDPHVLEPLYLPGHIPPVINPIDGIAVGISTTVPPHNLGETLRACIAMLDAGVLGEVTAKGASNLKNSSTAPFSIEQLMAYLPGPDYPEGGILMAGRSGVKEYLETGRGRFVIRAKLVLEQLTPTKRALVITQLPPVGRDRVNDSIIDAINERKLDGLVAEPPLDETNEERTRIVLELKRDAKPDLVMADLFKYTMLEVGVSAQLYFLFADQHGASATIPRQVGMVELLTYWLRHKLDVLERRLNFELSQFQKRFKVVEALIVGATNAQAIVKIFQEADGKSAAKEVIKTKYKVNEEQAEVIANMSLSQVTRPDAGKYLVEKAELVGKISSHQELLSSRQKRIALLTQELKETEKKFGDNRRTEINHADSVSSAVQAITKGSSSNPAKMAGVELTQSGQSQNGGTTAKTQPLHEELALVLYTDNSIKATPLAAFGAKSKSVKTDENILRLVEVASDEFVLASTNQGRVFGLPLERLGLNTRAARGESLARYLKLENGEQVIAFLPVPGWAFNTSENEAERSSLPSLFLVEFSAFGKVKKTLISEYRTATNTGLSSLKLGSNKDEVIAALLSDGAGEYFVTTSSGQTLRFSDEKLSAQGRIGQGQAAIDFATGIQVVSADFWKSSNRKVQKTNIKSTTSPIKQQSLDWDTQQSESKMGALQISLFDDDNSNIKGSNQYTSKNRSVQLIADKTKGVAEDGVERVTTSEESYLLILTKRGLLKKTSIDEFPQKGRATSGVVTLIFSSPDDKVVATKIVTVSKESRKEDAVKLALVSAGSNSVMVDVASLPILARAKKAQTIVGLNGDNTNNNQQVFSRIIPLTLDD